jgi:hypothetical protein
LFFIDAEDRLSKATDDLKRVTEHIEQEKAINKEVQRRQVNNKKNELEKILFDRFRCNYHQQIEIVVDFVVKSFKFLFI